jgi:hypothetical protein
LRAAFGISAISLAVMLAAQACGSNPPAAGDGHATPATGSGVVQSGPCTTEGQKVACHVETGRVDNIVNCFSGSQVCTNGMWGPCGGTDGTLTSVNTDELKTSSRNGLALGSGLSLMSVFASDASADAGACRSNPCNPYCQGIDVDADSLMPEGGFSTFAVLGTVKTPDQFPGGINGPKNAMSTYAVTSPVAYVPCTQGHPPGDKKICSSDYCCASFVVNGVATTCQPWAQVAGDNPVALSSCIKATGVDFELGLACNDSTTGNVHVPACNRGTTDATTGSVMVAEYAGNPQYAGSATYCDNPGAPSASCTVNLANAPIKAGKCIDIDMTAKTANGSTTGVTCAGSPSSGNRTMMINPPATSGYTTLSEGDPCNNYSFHPTTAQGGTCAAYGQQPPPPTALNYTYTATCPPGFAVQWNQLAYDSSVPATSEIIIQVSSAPLLPDGGTGAFTTPVQAADVKSASSPDPATCAINGAPDATVCPKNLATLLGPGANNNPVLDVGITLIATTAIPVAKSWQVTFNCIPNE